MANLDRDGIKRRRCLETFAFEAINEALFKLRFTQTVELLKLLPLQVGESALLPLKMNAVGPGQHKPSLVTIAPFDLASLF